MGRRVGAGWLLPTMLPVAVLAGLLVARHPRTVYTSDSTAQQSIVRTWFDVGHGVTHVPPDTWWMKVPYYLVLENLPFPPHTRLLIAVLALNITMFLLLGLAGRMLAPQARWYELAVPLVWLAALGGGIGSNRMLPNYRNVELGLIFVVLALVARYLTSPRRAGPWWRRALTGAGAALLLGLFWVDDPYFAILVAMPLAGASLGWYLLRRRESRYLLLSATLVGSMVAMAPLHWLARLAGVAIGDSAKTVAESFGAVWNTVLLLPPGVGIQLGVDHWDGGPLPVTAQAVLLVSLFAMLAASTALAVHGWRERLLVPFFIGLHWPLVIAAFLVSWYSQDIRTSRYLVLVVYDIAIGAVLLLPLLRERRPVLARGFVALLAVAGLLGAANGTAIAVEAASRPSVALGEQEQVVAAVRTVAGSGTVKGYAPFWQANINSYLVGDGVTAAELVCSERRLATRQWLSDTARLTRSAASSFVIWDADAVTLRGCDAALRDAQLGTPSRVVPAGPGTQVLVYPYDIATRLAPTVTPA